MVDAVNTPYTLAHYERNVFKPLFQREGDEKDFYHIDKADALKTRLYNVDWLLIR